MRLGLDIGASSIGWWLYTLEDGAISEVIDGGVRIFSDGRDPKSKASLAVERRAARAMRRRRDRFLRRKAALMKRMAEVGLMPADPIEAKALEQLDPYELRARGLSNELPLAHFGRALFHLNQRRGFKSNRKTDRGENDNESGKIKDATKRLDLAMATAIPDESLRTYGHFLHLRRSDRPEKPAGSEANKNGSRSDDRRTPPVRTRLSVAQRDGADKAEVGYDFYPDRRHLEEEFLKLWQEQASYHRDVLTSDLRDDIFQIIFFQRQLKMPEVGLCLFSGQHGVPENERRLPSAHPLNQRRILFETVNALRVAEFGQPNRPLKRDERDQIILALDTKEHTKSLSGMSIKLKALGKVIKLRPKQHFTPETANRDAIACDPVRASLSDPRRFGPRWSSLDIDGQWQVIDRLREVENEAEHQELMKWLTEWHGLNRTQAAAVANAPLPEGHGRIGRTATLRILDQLESDVIPYSEAVARCDWHHSDDRTGEILDELPYYGEILNRHVIPGTYNENDDEITRFGRITNPTVHIGLNQLRRLVNRIICVHGKPDEIVVEIARDLKKSEDQKREIERTIKKNTEAAKKRGDKLVNELGQRDTGANRLRLRLWEDLNPEDCLKRFCPYSGQRISAGMLFDGSCDVDHILPYSRTLDDSIANRTLCLTEFNRQKTDQTPWEAWGETRQWDEISDMLKYLPANKAWRFAPDAMSRFEGENDFQARALKDTQYLSKIARSYLNALYDGADGKSHVWVVPGRLTEMLRRHWGLNGIEAMSDSVKRTAKAKNRTDHRHHAIDAAVIAATDRALIKRISEMAKRDELDGAEEVVRSLQAPWEDFRNDIAGQLQRITVSHRADHGRIDPQVRTSGRDSTSGALHEATALSIIDDATVAVRVPLKSLSVAQFEEGGRSGWVRDEDLRQKLHLATKGKDGKALEAALEAFAAKPGPYAGILRVRLVKPMLRAVRVQIPQAAPTKAYQAGSNHCYEVWKLPDGKATHNVVQVFDAHRNRESRPHPAAKRLHRFMKGDLVRLDDSKFGPVTATVEKFNNKGMIELVPHNEANASDRYRKLKEDLYIRLGAASLLKAGARRVYVDEMGRVRDPGPRG